MPHIKPRAATDYAAQAPKVESHPHSQPEKHRPPHGKKPLRLQGKINLHDYEPDFSSITKALLGREAPDVDPKP